MVAEQLRRIDLTPLSIMLEPVGRNTAPAIAVAAIKAMEQAGDPLLLVLPADHVIYNHGRFHEMIEQGAVQAANGYLVTFGIVPDVPRRGMVILKKDGRFMEIKSVGIKQGQPKEMTFKLEREAVPL